MGDLLTTREAAIYLSNRLNEKINRGRLDVWRMRDQGPPYKSIGRRIYYDLDDLEEWIDEHSLWIKIIGQGQLKRGYPNWRKTYLPNIQE